MMRFNFTSIVTIFGFLFLYIPILILIIFSFNSSSLITVWQDFSFIWYVFLHGVYSTFIRIVLTLKFVLLFVVVFLIHLLCNY